MPRRNKFKGILEVVGGNLELEPQSSFPVGRNVNDVHLDDGTNTASGNPGWMYLVSTGPDIWDDVGGGGSGGSSPFEVDTGDNEIQPITVDIGRGFIVGSQDMDDSGAANDRRMFFEKATGAFRAGIATASAWDSGNRGVNSFAVGRNNIASGTESFASGANNTASGLKAHAEGYASFAAGDNSHVEGHNTLASGDHAHAEGDDSNATGDAAHAEGYNSNADGPNSHSEGYRTYATGAYGMFRSYGGAHAEGTGSYASGLYGSHAEGNDSIASGDYSHAEGSSCDSSGDGAHSEGYNTTASGSFSHSEGSDSVASGVASHAEGNNTTASGANGSHAEGWSSLASSNASHAEGKETEAVGVYSHAAGYRSIARLKSSKATAGNRFSSDGDGQNLRINCGTVTTDATPKQLSLDYNQATSDINISPDFSWAFTVRLQGRDSVGKDSYMALFEGMVYCNAPVIFPVPGPATVTLVPGPAPLSPRVTFASIGAGAWSSQIIDNTAGPAFLIEVTGAAATIIRWVAEIFVTEIFGVVPPI